MTIKIINSFKFVLALWLSTRDLISCGCYDLQESITGVWVWVWVRSRTNRLAMFKAWEPKAKLLRSSWNWNLVKTNHHSLAIHCTKLPKLPNGMDSWLEQLYVMAILRMSTRSGQSELKRCIHLTEGIANFVTWMVVNCWINWHLTVAKRAVPSGLPHRLCCNKRAVRICVAGCFNCTKGDPSLVAVTLHSHIILHWQAVALELGFAKACCDVEGQPISLGRKYFGRCVQRDVKWVHLAQPRPRTGRPGDFCPKYVTSDLQSRRMVRQTRRLQRMVCLLEKSHPHIHEDAPGLWDTILQATGFAPSFSRWMTWHFG